MHPIKYIIKMYPIKYIIKMHPNIFEAIDKVPVKRFKSVSVQPLNLIVLNSKFNCQLSNRKKCVKMWLSPLG